MKAKLALAMIAAATMGAGAGVNGYAIGASPLSPRRRHPHGSPCCLAPIMKLGSLGGSCSKCGKAIK